MAAAVSAREREVLLLLGEYLTHEQVAARLVVSVRTVESHVAALRRKLGVADHRALVRLAAAERAAAHTAAAGRPPVPLTALVGRTRELAGVEAALAASRLVTIAGPGGAGKTRLALAAAAALSGPVHWVDLVPVADADALADAVAAACGVTSTSRRGPLESVAAAWAERPLVLVLDNAEHVVNAVAVAVEDLLARCRGLRVLVTSRVRLALPAERVVRLGGLDAHDGGDALELFRRRAEAAGVELPPDADPDAEAVCAALDGLPLAIELAAVRLPTLGLAGVRRALVDQPGLLTGPERATARHVSIARTLDWSVELLGPAARRVLARLAVLVAPFDEATAVELAGFAPLTPSAVPAALGELVDHSLVEPAWASGRYRLLEPVRQYALTRLDTDDAAVTDRHRQWCVDGLAAHRRADDATAAARYLDDARAAVRRESAGAALAHELGLALFATGHLREARARLEQAAALAPDAAAADSLAAAADVARCAVDGPAALRLELELARRAERAGDATTAALARARAVQTCRRFPGMFATVPSIDADALLASARSSATAPRVSAAVAVAEIGTASADGAPSPAGARAALERAVAAGDAILESAARDALGAASLFGGDPVTAHQVVRERLRRLGAVRPYEPAHALEVKDALHMGVFVALGAGELAAARDYGDRLMNLDCLRERRDLAEDDLIGPAVLAGDWDTADAAAERFLSDWTAAGCPAAAGRALAPAAMALACGLRDDHAGRERWLQALARIRSVPRRHAWRGTGFGELFAAMLLVHRERPAAALAVLRTPGVHGGFGNAFGQWVAAWSAEAAVLAGRPDAGASVAAARRLSSGNPVAAAVVRRASGLGRGDRRALARAADELAAAGAAYEAARTRLLARQSAPAG